MLSRAHVLWARNASKPWGVVVGLVVTALLTIGCEFVLLGALVFVKLLPMFNQNPR